MYRNTPATLKVFAFNRTTNVPVTGDAANITCRFALDGGSRFALADTNPTEMEDGFYLFNVLAAENNGETADFFPESSTADVQVIVVEHNRYTVIPTVSSGARTVTITVQDSLAAAIQNATVRISRTGETFAAQTNASGVAVFNLDDATWTVSITATGFSFAGASLVVDGTETVTYTMTTAGGGVTPSTPPLTTGFWTVYDNLGVAQAGAQVSIQASSPPKGSTGIVMEDAVRTATADGNGVVQFSNLVKGATYTVYRTSSARRFQILVPTTAGTTVALGSIVG